MYMKITTVLTVIAIVAALGIATTLIPIHQVSAQGKGPGGFTPPGPPTTFPNHNAVGICGANSHNNIPFRTNCG